MDKEDLKELVGVAEEAKPEIEAFISKIQEYGPALRSLAIGIVHASCDFQIEAVNRYKAAGFTHDESILFTLNTSFYVSEALKRVRNSKK